MPKLTFEINCSFKTLKYQTDCVRSLARMGISTSKQQRAYLFDADDSKVIR